MNSSATNTAIAVFCKELREAREYQQITLPEVARATRVSLEYLEALEQGLWDRVPRAYLRGYLGLYAQALDLNKDKVLRGFDQLTSPVSGGGGAILEDAPPLLEEPEDVGITRAKIQVSWFAALSRNRSSIYILTIGIVLVIFLVIAITRKVQREKITPVPFQEAIAEGEQQLYAPRLVIPLASDSEVQVQKWVRWISADTGKLLFREGHYRTRSIHVNPYDTIDIQYLDSLIIKIHPAASIIGYVDSSQIQPKRTLVGDTALYVLKADEPIQMDSSGTVSDSGETVD